MSRLFQKLFRFVRRGVGPGRKIFAVETSAPDAAVPALATPAGDALDAAAYRAALVTLPAERRELLELHQIDDMSFIEIARITGISAADVEHEIAAAIACLAIHLEAGARGLTARPGDG